MKNVFKPFVEKYLGIEYKTQAEHHNLPVVKGSIELKNRISGCHFV